MRRRPCEKKIQGNINLENTASIERGEKKFEILEKFHCIREFVEKRIEGMTQGRKERLR